MRATADKGKTMTKTSRAGRRRVPLTLAAIVTLLGSLLATAAFADGVTLDFQQTQFYGLTAGEIADLGTSNQDDCGQDEGEVGWHFVAPGGHFDTVDITYSTGPQHFPGDEVKVQTAGKNGDVKGVYFATSFDATLDDATAFGQASGDKFVLSHVCVPQTGFLKVQKFIDVNADGILDGGDLTADDGTGNLAGWEFNVHAGSDTTGTLVDTLTTDTTGMTPTIELGIGTYTVEEVNTGRTITTAVAGGSTTEVTTLNPVTDDVLVDATTTYTFGNACLITKVFQITAPIGTQGVTAFYDTDLADDAISAGAVHVALSDPDNDGTYTGTAPDLFQIGDQIEWGFGVDTDGDGSLADEGAGFVDEQILDETFVVADGYPDCLKTNSGDLEPPEILITKYKDADDDGDPADLHDPLSGWTMNLYHGGGLVDSDTTDGVGEVLFDGLVVGETYVVCEDLAAEPNWLQTYPTDTDTISNPGDCHTVGPLEIGASESVEFQNSPLSDIKVGFTDLTGYTNVEITCTDADGVVVYHYDSTSNLVEVPGAEDFTDTVEELRIRQSTITCDFRIVDP